MRGGTLSDLDDVCGGDNSCPASAEDTADKGKLFTGLAEVTLALGVVGVAAGVFLLVTSGPKKPDAPTDSGGAPAARRGMRFIGAAPGADVGGASLMGSF
jgi:hypothetical protein